MKCACVGVLSITELKNARWNTEKSFHRMFCYRHDATEDFREKTDRCKNYKSFVIIIWHHVMAEIMWTAITSKFNGCHPVVWHNKSIYRYFTSIHNNYCLTQLYFTRGDMFRLFIQPSSGQLTIEQDLLCAHNMGSHTVYI